jgi:hypothetical protein
MTFSTLSVGLSAPKASPNSSTKAISTFIAGPARITTTRFQTGWL